MKSFLVRNKKPICSWTKLPEGTLFKGDVPEGFNLAVNPSKGYIIVDVDRHEEKDGFNHIPDDVLSELNTTFHYSTKNNGVHYWLQYEGKQLMNKPSGLGIDLRTEKGYVVWYSNIPLEDAINLIKPCSEKLTLWLLDLFTSKNRRILSKIIKTTNRGEN